MLFVLYSTTIRLYFNDQICHCLMILGIDVVRPGYEQTFLYLRSYKHNLIEICVLAAAIRSNSNTQAIKSGHSKLWQYLKSSGAALQWPQGSCNLWPKHRKRFKIWGNCIKLQLRPDEILLLFSSLLAFLGWSIHCNYESSEPSRGQN